MEFLEIRISVHELFLRGLGLGLSLGTGLLVLQRSVFQIFGPLLIGENLPVGSINSVPPFVLDRLIEGQIVNLGVLEHLHFGRESRKIVLKGRVHIENLPSLQVQKPFKPVGLACRKLLRSLLLLVVLGIYRASGDKDK